MSTLNSRLSRIEREANVFSSAPCRLCCGEPHGNVFETHVPVVNGRELSKTEARNLDPTDIRGLTGFRKTGERYLDPEWYSRITDDLRCRGCGRRAVPTKWFIVIGMGPQMPEGARLLEPGVWGSDNQTTASSAGR